MEEADVLKLRMENYIRKSGRIAMGQKCDPNADALERIAGKVIWRVSVRFIGDKKINEFIENNRSEDEAIYQKWQTAFGKAVYEEFDNIELNKFDHTHREAAKERYKI